MKIYVIVRLNMWARRSDSFWHTVVFLPASASASSPTPCFEILHMMLVLAFWDGKQALSSNSGESRCTQCIVSCNHLLRTSCFHRHNRETSWPIQFHQWPLKALAPHHSLPGNSYTWGTTCRIPILCTYHTPAFYSCCSRPLFLIRSPLQSLRFRLLQSRLCCCLWFQLLALGCLHLLSSHPPHQPGSALPDKRVGLNKDEERGECRRRKASFSKQGRILWQKWSVDEGQ